MGRYFFGVLFVLGFETSQFEMSSGQFLPCRHVFVEFLLICAWPCSNYAGMTVLLRYAATAAQLLNCSHFYNFYDLCDTWLYHWTSGSPQGETVINFRVLNYWTAQPDQSRVMGLYNTTTNNTERLIQPRHVQHHLRNPKRSSCGQCLGMYPIFAGNSLQNYQPWEVTESNQTTNLANLRSWSKNVTQ